MPGDRVRARERRKGLSGWAGSMSARGIGVVHLFCCCGCALRGGVGVRADVRGCVGEESSVMVHIGRGSKGASVLDTHPGRAA